jgi:spore coat polysaccharide biosynthesis protein SpsF
MKTVAVIQARMSSTRLPGKVMLPLAGEHILTHNVRRVDMSDMVDETVVATSERTADDIVARYADRAGATVFRGSEADVLGRVFGAAGTADADHVIRITADCPLVAPDVVGSAAERVVSEDLDYASNIIDRTFPRGLDVEAFTFESLERVHNEAREPHHREHVTPYYREHPDRFGIGSVTASDVYEESWMRDRTDLRLTLDEADDYELLRTVYEGVSFGDILPVRDAVRYVDENDLSGTNAAIEQKELFDVPGDSSR